MRRSLTALAGLLVATCSLAAENTAPAPVQELPVEYAVELLLFLREPQPSGETWPAEPERPEPSMAIATVTGGTPPEFPPELRIPAVEQQLSSGLDGTTNSVSPVATDATTPAAPPSPAGAVAGSGFEEPLTLEGMLHATPELTGPIQPLPMASLQLSAHAQALRRRGLEPVLHVGWKQVVGDRANKDWLWLETESIYGLVRISLGRYLHIDTRLLQLAATDNPEQRQPILAVDHRRMRSGELHHLDQPGFGMLVQINRYEAPEHTPATAEPLMLEPLDSPQAPLQSGKLN